ncbi:MULTISPECIES: acyl carrier protein [unclassified Kitasatospora]|uniref:acyl carrier protein n=1 Tax=unclassified Kitasatospora TaxID=2633591 RepID=UPI000709FCF9|nr:MULTISPECIES: acyl carrier protein [unclassified Kitasatospora]KQV15489.1 hypothetical protein ASC99_07850 [Kitasatospora sp. Root107]KRB63924.1 hypothetical protein ASE03_05015 [Kitasatospora sp. Root187]
MSTIVADTVRDNLIHTLGVIKKREVGAELAADDNFMRALNMDSLDAVELTVRLSSDHGVEFGAEPDDLDALESLGALIDLVVRRGTR